jgi:hypothetical protein
MKWVTRSHVHVDRVACPWLIKRFVDSDAEFVFVPSNQVAHVAERENAIPFDAPGSGAKLGHRNGNCTFDAIIEDYGLTDKALLELAKIVRAADTNNFADHSVAAGLEAIAVGFSIRFPDDYQNLESQFAVYDALFAWCRMVAAMEWVKESKA